MRKQDFFDFDLDSEYPDISETVELDGVIELFEGDRLRELLNKIRANIKELGHIIYNYKDLKNPETGNSFYNSYNHYYRIAKKALEGFDDIEYYGIAKTDFNPGRKRDIRKCCNKLHTFCYTLGAISTYEETSREVNGLDEEQIEVLIDELDELATITNNELANKNYFVVSEIEEEIEDLFTLPDSDIFGEKNKSID